MVYSNNQIVQNDYIMVILAITFQYHTLISGYVTLVSGYGSFKIIPWIQGMVPWNQGMGIGLMLPIR